MTDQTTEPLDLTTAGDLAVELVQNLAENIGDPERAGETLAAWLLDLDLENLGRVAILALRDVFGEYLKYRDPSEAGQLFTAPAKEIA